MVIHYIDVHFDLNLAKPGLASVCKQLGYEADFRLSTKVFIKADCDDKQGLINLAKEEIKELIK